MVAKDYFQDILSQSGTQNTPQPKAASDTSSGGDEPQPGEKSIRNITVSPRRAARSAGNDMRGISTGNQPPASSPFYGQGGRDSRRKWIWVAAAISFLVLLILGFVAFRDTKITVTPYSRGVVFDQNAKFTAYPAATAASGALSYTVVTNDIEDTVVVPSKGTEYASEKASGNITVYNDYSSAPVKLIKNTRFATPEGLVFRIPASATIPGKKGTTPGSITLTVFADQPGTEYNIGLVARFTLPGLKSSPDMYAKVYARSTSAMSGGFSGERPAVAPGALESARAEVRGRLESKAREAASALSGKDSIVFPDLARITYSSSSETAEAGGGLRIHEKADVQIPVFPDDLFASAVYHMTDVSADNASVALEGANSLSARIVSSDPELGTSPIEFTVGGTAKLVWNIDTNALASALALKNQSVFQEVIKGFPSIAEARATIAPFWKSSFPEADKISVILNAQKGNK